LAQRRNKRGRGVAPRCEADAGVERRRTVSRLRAIGKERYDATRDGRSRVELSHGPRCEFHETHLEKRVMRAGEHHDIGRDAAVVAKAGRDLGEIS